MPEALTIKDAPTTAEAPEQSTETTEESSGLLAGKYKSQEELEKGYLELQKQLGKQPSEDSGTTEDQPEQGETETPQGAREIYGDYIGERFEQAGIKYEEMNEHFQKEGTLTDQHFEELNKAGFTKDVVESYLAGIQQKSAVTEQQIYDIKEEYGGDTGYANMMDWAGQTLSDAEKSAFSVGINNPNIEVVKLTVAGLHSKYVKATGTEPNLIGGKTPSAPSEKFESHDQLVRAMNDEKYSTDPAYRKMIERKIANSSIF